MKFIRITDPELYKDANGCYTTREAYIAALVNDVEALVLQEFPNGGRKIRRASRAIGEKAAYQCTPVDIWEGALKGSPDAQEAHALDFLDYAQGGFLAALDDFRRR